MVETLRIVDSCFDLLAFEFLHLCQTSFVSFRPGELSRQKCLNQLPRQRWSDHFSTEANDVHVVIFHALMCREHVVYESGSSAGNFVRGDRRANATAAECYATFHLPGGDGFGQRDDKIGVVTACPDRRSRSAICSFSTNPPWSAAIPTSMERSPETSEPWLRRVRAATPDGGHLPQVSSMNTSDRRSLFRPHSGCNGLIHQKQFGILCPKFAE